MPEDSQLHVVLKLGRLALFGTLFGVSLVLPLLLGSLWFFWVFSFLRVRRPNAKPECSMASFVLGVGLMPWKRKRPDPRSVSNPKPPIAVLLGGLKLYNPVSRTKSPGVLGAAYEWVSTPPPPPQNPIAPNPEKGSGAGQGLSSCAYLELFGGSILDCQPAF